MIGHNQAFKYLYDNNQFDSIFIFIGDPPKDFVPNEQYSSRPEIYTGRTRPIGHDLAFVKGFKVMLFQCTEDDSLFASWYIHLKTKEPEYLITYENCGEIHVN